ncbi:MAG: potassium-transporting ATPase subunit KdpC [Candidatus Nanopelagicales bacterium]
MNVTRQVWAAVRLMLVFTVVLGLLYPLAGVLAAKALGARTDGSLIERDGSIVGSSLIGQQFDGQRWFYSRPSAAGDGYDAIASGGSNLGPNNPELVAAITLRTATVAARERVAPEAVPADAVTASGSGLDPGISPEYAAIQVPRVARSRGLAEDQVRAMVAAATTQPGLGFLGEASVNVLEINEALERAQ